ncbi:MAG: 3-phosphoshikimate 1-carboxyvinyltransferase [Pseudomonadota bacterium]
MSHATPSPLKSSRSGGLTGTFQVPGDKSISHRALMLGAVSMGETTISGLLESADIHGTARAMAAFGARVERHQDGRWTVNGLGTGGLMEPKMPIDFGNAGTGVRLAIGLASTCPIRAKFTGDQSLCKRPMGRIMDPLSQFGTQFEATDGDRLPLQMTGAKSPIPQEYTLPVASAQVKSALLLGALNVPGCTTVVEPVPTRDHTERMLTAFGADLEIKHTERGREVNLNGPAELTGQSVTVPADPSSAAFPMVAALITEGSDLTLPNMMMNETRTGLLGVLQDMGGDIKVDNIRETGGETLADLRVRSSKLKGVAVDPAIAPSMIDEYPILAVAAACAEGSTEMRGLEELRVKESDRLAAIVAGLENNGVTVRSGDDWLIVEGSGRPPGGGTVATHMDHRIAMAFLVLGLVSEKPVIVDDGGMIATSFPDFVELMNAAGAPIEAAEALL